ncbi:MAG: 30S ribosomal protein S7 [Mycoplasmataceae bacterium]|nr:30S ribosomal protein S7 [Mycoplasmataceae bacterium]
MRKNRAEKRDILPDPVFNSKIVAKAINMIMLDGKRGLAQNTLYGAFEKVEQKTKKPAIEIFNKALENIEPVVELKVRRVAGSNYQVPTEVSPERKITLGLRWLVLYARNRSEKSILDRLAGEIIDASNGIGGAVKKKDDTHNMAEDNKAFAHLRF